MNSGFLKTPTLLTVAVGAGVMIGAAGVFLYEHLIKEKRRLILQRDVMNLGMSVTELRREVEELREAQMARRRSRRAAREEHNSTASVSESDVDMMSIVDDEDEFFDFSDAEDYPTVVSRDWHETKRDGPENKLYKHIDDRLSNPDLAVKLEVYDELKKLNNNDPEVLWRLAKVCHGIGVIKGITDGLDVKKTYIDEAVTHASNCLDRAPRSSEAHKWYAITVGSRGEFQPTKNKIKDGFVFKEHIEEALKISPNDPTLLHLLGRFRYEVATLSWVERKVANAVFGEVPFSTFPEALEALLRVEELNKEPWMENRLMVAKCYINMGDFKEALVWLDRARAVEPRSLEEVRLANEISELVDKYDRYRTKEKQKSKKC
uniref:Regulator of microtubule dynamics protein 1 n=1 Tax=Lygus hesperus TaxID=30085 RepID=A0A0A9WMH1_LYGHE